ncbi:hypothetical protein WJX73_004780 [Symbiochloris irregularis]|uniref:CCT domain-containing protein n=1 Tax=Symbiochloris irregularis TaxID=706552 RepID=A0AAW1PGD4_9CHLO
MNGPDSEIWRPAFVERTGGLSVNRAAELLWYEVGISFTRSGIEPKSIAGAPVTLLRPEQLKRVGRTHKRNQGLGQQSTPLRVFPVKQLDVHSEGGATGLATTPYQLPGPGPPQAQDHKSAFVDKSTITQHDSSSEDGDTVRLYHPVPGTAGTQCSTQTLSSFTPMQAMASNSLSRLHSSRSEGTAQGMPASTLGTTATPAETAQPPVTSATPSDSAAAQDTTGPSWNGGSGSGSAQDASVHLPWSHPQAGAAQESAAMSDSPACPSETVKEASADGKQDSQDASVQQPAADGSAADLPKKLQQADASGQHSDGPSKDASESDDIPSEEGRGPSADTQGRDTSGSGQGSLQGFRAYVSPQARLGGLNLPQLSQHFNRSGTTGSSVAANSTAANLSAAELTKQSAAFESLGTDDMSRSTRESSEAAGGEDMVIDPQVAFSQRKENEGAGALRIGPVPNMPDFIKEMAGDGMQPFWMQSNAQASANEQAEMAAFCRAYAQTAAAAKREAGSQSMEDACMQDLQRRHMIMALQSHVMFQQQLMMQHHIMMGGMFPGGNGQAASGQQPQQSQQQQTPPVWPPYWGQPSYTPASSEHLPTSSFMPSGGMPPIPHNQSAGADQQQAQQQPATGQQPSAAGDGADTVAKDGKPNQQERRALALNKYKQKRKNLCFTKKIRYESRKQLAKARPRVKGQFVRRSSLGLAEMDGINDLLEPVATLAAQDAAREAAEAVMSLAHGKIVAAPEAEAEISDYEDAEAAAPVPVSPRRYRRRG